MPNIIFTSNLLRHVECPVHQVTGSTVYSALQEYFKIYPQAKSYILDDQDRLRKHMNVAINNELITDRKTLSDLVNSEDEIYILQALSGG